MNRRVTAIAGLLSLCLMLLASTASAQPFAYGINSDADVNADQLLRINLENGAATEIGALPGFLTDVEGLAFSPEGVLYAADNATKTLIRIDLGNAETELVDSRRQNLGFSTSTALDLGMTFNCSGELLMVAEQTQSLYRVDTETGQARVVGQSGGLGDMMTAMASHGDQVFTLSAENNGLYRIDDVTGLAELVGRVENVDIRDAGMAFDADGRLWAILDGSDSSLGSYDPSLILELNPLNAEIISITETLTGIESLAISPPTSCDIAGPMVMPVPATQPAGMIVLIMMLSLMGLVRLKP